MYVVHNDCRTSTLEEGDIEGRNIGFWPHPLSDYKYKICCLHATHLHYKGVIIILLLTVNP